MNINASINSGFNLSLRKKEKQSFQTIFDKLDARSKKMNYCNPVNSGMTNDQMFRFYLNETEPMLHNNNDTFDFNDMMDGDLKDMKLSDFAKLLTGNLGTDINTKYQSLPATVSQYPNPVVARLLAPVASTGIAAPITTPAAAPITTPAAAPITTPAAAPIATPAAAPITTPAAAPITTPAAAPIATPPASPTSSAAAPITTPAAAPITTPAAAPITTPAAAVAPTPPASPTSSAAAATLASLSAATTSPSGTSVPTASMIITRSTSAAAASLLTLSASTPAPSPAPSPAPATATVSSSSPTRGAATIAFPETPESKKLKPEQIQLAAQYVNILGLDPTKPLEEDKNTQISTFVGFNLNETFFSSPEAAGARPSSPTASVLSANPTATGTPESGYRNATDVIAVKNAIAAGLNPPRVPKELPEARYNNPGWAKHFSDMLDYNESLEKDPATNKKEFKLRITQRMRLIIETYRTVLGDEKQFKAEIEKRKSEYDSLPKEK
jgi:hypothetical protein